MNSLSSEHMKKFGKPKIKYRIPKKNEYVEGQTSVLYLDDYDYKMSRKVVVSNTKAIYEIKLNKH